MTGGNNIKMTGGDPSDYFGHNNEDHINKYNVTVYLFKAGWCGHCKNFKDIWNNIAETYSKSHSNQINFIAYDYDLHKSKVEEWKIKGFPTIMIRRGDNAEEYNSDRDYDTFFKFIKSLIN
jgi:thiol-disulfide isomerase/thioredoxin